MTPVAERAISVLHRARLTLGPGLTDDQISEIEGRYAFRFNPDHRDVLRQVTPDGWIDWLGDEESVRDRLTWPIEGFLFDVERAFWMPAWGERPARKTAAIDIARQRLTAEHTLVPITGHRYIPAAPEPSGAPVLSVYQTDVIYYGADLADYCAFEYLGESIGATPRPVPFWSDVVDGAGAVHFW